jgi:predicted DsbA family dithiol-disulfide isomerase
MKIEVYSDLVCPWCYLGKRRLEAALAQRPNIVPRVQWLPFELNPDLPAEGMDRAAYLQEKFGSTDRFAAAQAQLASLGESHQISFDFAAIARMPNTRRAHVLLRAAHAAVDARADTLKEQLLAAYFSRGEDLTDETVLCRAAEAAGLSASAAIAALRDAALLDAVIQHEQQAVQWGVSGVPTFIFARRYAFSGAQEVPQFLAVIDRLENERSLAAPA